MYDLTLITVNYHSERLLQRLLDSAVSLKDLARAEWIIVDNSPGDRLLEQTLRASSALGAFRVLVNSQNEGFGAGCNLAVTRAESPMLFFLNPDCVFKGGSLGPLLERLRQDEGLAAVGPRLEDAAGRVEVSGGCFPGIFTEAKLKAEKWLAERSPRLRRLYARRFNHRREMDWVTGGALLVRRTAFEQIGGFDEKFFLYFEDIDLCRRLREAGYRIGFDPSLTLVHDRGGSVKDLGHAAGEIYRRSQVYYYSKHKNSPARWALRAYLHLTGRYPAGK